MRAVALKLQVSEYKKCFT